MEKTIELTCAYCNKIFDKSLREYNRQIKKGNIRFFCNLSCNAYLRNKENPPPGNPQNLIADNRRDEYTSFRWFVNRGTFRSKSKKRYDCNITVEFLKELWEKQNGTCPFTGWKLILPKDSSYPWEEYKTNNASLDRIDNSKGYIEGNVRFVSVMANLARQTFTDEDLIEFCKCVTSHR